MANRDLVSSGNATGSPPLDRIVEPEAAFGGELENDDGDEHLRDARDAEPVIDPHRSARLHARKPARSLPCPRAVGDDRHPARRAAGLEHVAQELLNARRRGRCARCIGWRGTIAVVAASAADVTAIGIAIRAGAETRRDSLRSVGAEAHAAAAEHLERLRPQPRTRWPS